MKEDEIIVLILKDILVRWKQSAGMETAAPRKNGKMTEFKGSQDSPDRDSEQTRVLGREFSGGLKPGLDSSVKKDEGQESSSGQKPDDGEDLMETIILRPENS